MNERLLENLKSRNLLTDARLLAFLRAIAKYEPVAAAILEACDTGRSLDMVLCTGREKGHSLVAEELPDGSFRVSCVRIDSQTQKIGSRWTAVFDGPLVESVSLYGKL